jgi:magnesium-transporting ATPase (P-type)
MGILIKGGDAFQAAHEATALIFDKTGTLTTGKAVVTDELAFGPEGEELDDPQRIDEMLKLAATAEQAGLVRDRPLAQVSLMGRVSRDRSASTRSVRLSCGMPSARASRSRSRSRSKLSRDRDCGVRLQAALRSGCGPEQGFYRMPQFTRSIVYCL